MSNLTVSNVGSYLQNGQVEKMMDRGLTIETPESPARSGGAAMDPGVAGPAGNPSESSSFSQMLRDSLDQLNDSQLQADRAIKELTAGRNKNIHETMLMIEQADMSFRLAMQVRNKVIDAYREVMRMQV